MVPSRTGRRAGDPPRLGGDINLHSRVQAFFRLPAMHRPRLRGADLDLALDLGERRAKQRSEQRAGFLNRSGRIGAQALPQFPIGQRAQRLRPMIPSGGRKPIQLRREPLRVSS